MTSTRSRSTDAEYKAIKARIKKEYRKVWDKDYDEKTKRDENPTGKVRARTKSRGRKGHPKRSRKSKTVRKTVLIL